MRASSLCSSIVFLIAVRVRSSLEKSRSASAVLSLESWLAAGAITKHLDKLYNGSMQKEQS